MLRVLRATAARTSRASSFSPTRNLSAAAILPQSKGTAERAADAHCLPGYSFLFVRNFSSSSSSQQRHDDPSPSAAEPETKLDIASQMSSSGPPEAHDDTSTIEQLAEDPKHEALSAPCSANADADEVNLDTKPEKGFDEGLELHEDATQFTDDTDSSVSAGQENEASDSTYADIDEDDGDLTAEPGKDSTSDFVAESEEDCAIDMSKVPEDLKEMMEDSYVCESAEEDFPSSEGPLELLTLDEVKQVLEEVRARDVKIFSVHDRCEWTDLMVLATGISDRHVRGIADALVYKIKKKGIVESPLYPTIEGQVGGKWLVVDCGNIVIHVLNEESRAYYRLEDLWTGELRPSTADEDFETMLNQAGLKDVVP